MFPTKSERVWTRIYDIKEMEGLRARLLASIKQNLSHPTRNQQINSTRKKRNQCRKTNLSHQNHLPKEKVAKKFTIISSNTYLQQQQPPDNHKKKTRKKITSSTLLMYTHQRKIEKPNTLKKSKICINH